MRVDNTQADDLTAIYKRDCSIYRALAPTTQINVVVIGPSNSAASANRNDHPLSRRTTCSPETTGRPVKRGSSLSTTDSIQ